MYGRKDMTFLKIKGIIFVDEEKLYITLISIKISIEELKTTAPHRIRKM